MVFCSCELKKIYHHNQNYFFEDETSLYKDWYLDKEKNRSIYFKGFNLGSSLSLTKETSSINEILKIDASIFEVGFEGKYINFHWALGYNQDYVSINLDWMLSNKNNERNN